MRAVQQHLLQLRLLLPTLLHVVNVAHDAGEGSVTALERKIKTLFNPVTLLNKSPEAMGDSFYLFRAFQFAQSLQDFTQFVFDGAIIQVLGILR